MNQGASRGPHTITWWRTRCFGSAILLLLPLVLAAVPEAAADPADRNLEPSPPWIFFDQPDPLTEEEIRHTLKRGYADQNLVIPARAAHVERFGVLSAPILLEELKAGTNQPYVWNSCLTVTALRTRWGNARELWPLLPPLLELADGASEPYTRAFASLALGTFRSVAFAPEIPTHVDPVLVRVPEKEVQDALNQLVAVLGRHVDDDNPTVRVAVAFALGKTGATKARAVLNDQERLGESDLRDAAVAPRRAVLLAIGLLPGQDDEPIFLRALADGERRIRQAAALAVSLQALRDRRPGWTNEPRKVLRALKSPATITAHLEDGAETVFTRGVLASLGLAAGEWRVLFDLARQPSTEETAARSAAQALLFCREPWFSRRAHLSVKEGVELEPVVLAALLLRIGEEASEEGLDLCRRYLSINTRSPRGKPEWDVRYFAAVGLLRALASGNASDEGRRAAILELLREGVNRGLKPGPFRDALARLLTLEGRPLREDTAYLLPEARLLKVERSFHDPHGLFARDIEDMAIVRLNDMVPVLFDVNSLKPGQPGNRDKTEMPRRFLKAAQEHYPYFTRLDLLEDRGRRPKVEMPPADVKDDEVRDR